MLHDLLDKINIYLTLSFNHAIELDGITCNLRSSKNPTNHKTRMSGKPISVANTDVPRVVFRRNGFRAKKECKHDLSACQPKDQEFTTRDFEARALRIGVIRRLQTSDEHSIRVAEALRFPFLA